MSESQATSSLKRSTSTASISSTSTTASTTALLSTPILPSNNHDSLSFAQKFIVPLFTKFSTATKDPPPPPQSATYITNSQLIDVWLQEITPKLHANDIIALSRVNKWAHTIAHNTTQHCGYALARSISSCREGVVRWPNLKWELRLVKWNQLVSTEFHHQQQQHQQQQQQQQQQPAPLCDGVYSLVLTTCTVNDFSFIDMRKLENFYWSSYCALRLDAAESQCIANTLLSSTSHLVSLSLESCLDKHDDAKWLVNVLVHLPHLTQLSLFENALGGGRIKQVTSALCHMSHITSLNLGANSIDSPGMVDICDCIANMQLIKTLRLAKNKIGQDVAERVSTTLANKHHMTCLDLSGNKILSEGVMQLLPCVTQLHRLEFLSFQNNDVDDETRQIVRAQLACVKRLFV